MTVQARSPGLLSTGLRCRCPRCGEGRLFDGYLTLRPACASCGLDYAFVDAGDGPAFFVMTIVGVIVVAGAAWVEVAWEPPIWVHILLWFPLTFAISFAMVRPAKGLMIALQYRHGAEEGRFRQ